MAMRFSPSLEKLVRAFQQPQTAPDRPNRTPVESDGDLAILTWGGELEVTDLANPGELGFQIVNFGSKSDSQRDPRKSRNYSEVSRSTKVVRVYNDQDQSQWVDVERIVSITFRGPDDVDVTFDLND